MLHTRKFKKLLPPGTFYKLSMDGDGCHKGANLAQFGITKRDIVPLPSLSSDMHRVPENCHANLQHHMQRWLIKHEQENPGMPVTGPAAMQELQTAFDHMTETSEIARNVMSLKRVYQAIIDAGGGYAPKSLRA